MIVKIARCRQRSISTAQHSMHKFLCCGLPVRAGKCYHGDRQLIAMISRKVLKRLKHVIDENKAIVLFEFGIIDHGKACTFLKRLRSEFVGIEFISSQRKEYGTRGDLSRVG